MINNNGCDWVHMDVMDGIFVPNLTFGPKMVADIRPLTKLSLDVHLMIVNPDALVEEFARAGADYLTFHVETVVHSHRLIQKIRDLGVKPGISIVPSTPVSQIVELLPYVDQVLVMSVNPGFSGQKMIETCLDKVSKLKELRDQGAGDYLIALDGGVNEENAHITRDAGADVLVSGSSFFNSKILRIR